MGRKVTGAISKDDPAYKPKNVRRARILRGEIMPKKKRRTKYGAKGMWIEDVFFASQAEGRRFQQLKVIEATGLITRLELQPTYQVVVNNKLCCRYRADFRYDVIDDRGTVLKQVVEDVKGMSTPLYKLKKKLVQATHGIEIIEIPAGLITKWENRLP
jgi:hypothetical protein